MPHRILICSGESEISDSLDDFLHRQLGYLVDVAETGDEAVDRAMSDGFDLCILDVAAEGHSGVEIYRRLNTVKDGFEPIFLCDDDDREATRDFTRFSHPVDRIVEKPVDDLGALTRLIIGILGPPKV